MSTVVDVARHLWGISPAVADDAEVAGRLHTHWVRYKHFGDNADSIFHRKPEAFAAYEQNDAETMARLLDVPWPVPVPVTLQSLTTELEALVAKFRSLS